jgi:hypothetical protein
MTTTPTEDEQREEYERHERWLVAFAFERVETRRTRFKRKCEPGCGCWIDGGELYRYMVWKMNQDAKISQRYDCETCARGDLAEGRSGGTTSRDTWR